MEEPTAKVEQQQKLQDTAAEQQSAAPSASSTVVAASDSSVQQEQQQAYQYTNYHSKRIMVPTAVLYPLSNYTFGKKPAHIEKDRSVKDRLARWEVNYAKTGMRRSVEGIILVHSHGHPHILLLQIANTFFKLPGGRLRPGENEVDGLKRKLTNRLADREFAPEWEVKDLVATRWRPNFEQHLYPYIPVHCTKPKECKKIFLVTLPEKCYFAVPQNLKLLAVPLFELYDNPGRYGPVIASIPNELSRFRFNCADE